MVGNRSSADNLITFEFPLKRMVALDSLPRQLNKVWQRISGQVPAPWSEFDANWYRQQYPDIDIHGAHPWHHFYLSGVDEGRLPNPMLAELWASHGGTADALYRYLHGPNRFGRYVAATNLARWHARYGQWPMVVEALRHALPRSPAQRPDRPTPLGLQLLWIEALRQTGNAPAATTWLDHWRQQAPRAHDLTLAQANALQTSTPNTQVWLDAINPLFTNQSLTPLVLLEQHRGLTIGNLACQPAAPVDPGPLVSIIVPAYNAASSLPMVLRCLTAQTWRALEILVVDDGSTDHTAEVANQVAQRDTRIRVLALGRNQGAYHARNVGLSHATGEFITVHDSDDWSHCQKIEKQVGAFLHNPQTMAAFSHWSRTTAALEFGGWHTPEGWTSWTHRNISSMMLRRQAVQVAGYWDEVKCSADTEYYYRIMLLFGREAIQEALPGTPLALGVSSPTSLTQQSDTHIFSIFGGARQQYHQAFQRWHATTAKLYLPQAPAQRPFPAPAAMLQKQ